MRMLPHPCVLLAALLLVPATAGAVDGPAGGSGEWIRRVAAAREEVAGQRDRTKAAQRALMTLSIDFPVRTDWLLQDLPGTAWQLLMPGTADDATRRLAAKVGIDGGQPRLLERYLAACEARREQRLRAVLDRWAPFVFAEGATHRMSFIGYTEGLSDARHERFFKPGSRLTLLEFSGGSTRGRTRTLIDDPHGMLRDVDVSPDRERLLFAWKKSDRLDDYHIYEYRLEEGGLRQLTRGIGRADYEPAYLPGGDIIFASTRPEQSVPCWWTEISNLYRMSSDGRHVRRLAIDQVHTLYPQVMSDGRVCYTRWDYNDRGQNYPHPVFAMNPDGKAQRVLYGGNSWFPTSLLHTRAIPGSHKVMSIAAGHHTRQHGKLVVIDPEEGRDEGVGMHFIAPRREVAYERVDVAMQHGDQFRYPYPLSEDECLVSYLPDYGFVPDRKFKDSEHYGLYWINADGERELLHRAPDLGVLRPATLGERPVPPQIPETVDYTRSSGAYYVHDVYRGIGLEGVERGQAKKIRVVRLNYRAAGVGKTHNRGEGGGSINSAPVAIANGTWDIKEILGDADIHPDGSALFEVPAMESIYLQVLDDKGRALQTSRTWDTLRPGETKSCMGCHDKTAPTFEGLPERPSVALRKGAQKLQPFYGPPRGFSFPREVQPILDSKCVSCHDGSEKGVMDLTGTPVEGKNLNQRLWSRSYLNLTGARRDKDANYTAVPETGLVTWISKMSRPTELPHSQGSIRSPLMQLLEKGHHGVKLSDEEYHKLAAWIDLLVPFCGTYREAHAWSDQDMRYYDYFEHKRREQAREEAAAVEAYIHSIAGGSAVPQDQAAFTRATYRVLPLAGRWRSAGQEGWKLAGDAEPAVVDRAELPPGCSGVELQLMHAGKELGRLKSDGVRGVLSFPHPVHAGRLVVRVVSGAMAPDELRFHGLEVRDLPENEGYRRHLEFVR